MKFVIIGGSGRIGSKLVGKLRDHGHDVVSASPDTGVNTLTGQGLDEALRGANVVVDVSNSPSFEDAAALQFFVTSTTNLLDAELAAGVGHHVALSVVGTEELQQSGYFRAKLAQETLISGATIPYTIVRACQFYEFLGAIANAATSDDAVRLPSILVQPMAADDVAAALAEIAVEAPANGIVEVAGPTQWALDEVVRQLLAARHDARRVITDPAAPYWGIEGVGERTLVPRGDARLSATSLNEWANEPAVAKS